MSDLLKARYRKVLCMYRGTWSVLVRGTEWVERISRRDMSKYREVPEKSRTGGMARMMGWPGKSLTGLGMSGKDKLGRIFQSLECPVKTGVFISSVLCLCCS